MDPNECLREIEYYMEEIGAEPEKQSVHHGIDGDHVDETLANAHQLVEHLENLSWWMKHGGFLPSAWQDSRK